MKTTRLCRKLLFGKTTKFTCCCILTKFLLFLFLQTQWSLNTSNHASFAKFFKGEKEYIYFKNFSYSLNIHETKQNLTWRELFAIQFALESFAPKISNKSVCWETENSSASLTVTSESNNTDSPDLLGTQSHKTFKNIPSQSTLAVPFWHSASSSAFLQSYASRELNSYAVDCKVFTHHINVFSWGKISRLNRFKPI